MLLSPYITTVSEYYFPSGVGTTAFLPPKHTQVSPYFLRFSYLHCFYPSPPWSEPLSFWMSISLFNFHGLFSYEPCEPQFFSVVLKSRFPDYGKLGSVNWCMGDCTVNTMYGGQVNELGHPPSEHPTLPREKPAPSPDMLQMWWLRNIRKQNGFRTS